MYRLLAPVLLVSCGYEPCTTLGCAEEGVEIVLVHEGWTAADGTVEVTIDGTVHDCEVSLPAGDIDEQYCGVSGDVLLRFSGETGELASVWVNGDEIEALHLKLTIGGAVLVDADVDFTWEKSFPNGPGCGPECLTASEELSF